MHKIPEQKETGLNYQSEIYYKVYFSNIKPNLEKGNVMQETRKSSKKLVNVGISSFHT